MKEGKVEKIENHVAGLTIAAVIAIIIASFVFDIPASNGPLMKLIR